MPRCLLLTQSGHSVTEFQCPLLGVKRTSQECAAMSAFDPKRTSGCHMQFVRSLRFDVGGTDYLSPLIDFFGDEFAKFGGRVCKRQAAGLC